MRYVGQGYEVSVPLREGKLDASLEASLRASFNRLYRERFGTSLESAAVECVHWRLTATVASHEQKLSFQKVDRGEPLKGERKAYFRELDAYVECPVLDRYQLAADGERRGPALIEERESTIVVGPSARWRVDELGDVVISLGNAGTTTRHNGAHRSGRKKT
jgi:N-methylhydantoinase A